MNWKTEAMERLKKYEGCCHAIHNIPLEIKRLELEARSPARASLEQTAGKATGRREDKLLNNIVFRQTLRWSLEQTRQWLDATNDALQCLAPEERLILQRLYIYQEKDGLERLCRELGVERSSIYRYRDRALEKFTVALFGKSDNFPKMAG